MKRLRAETLRFRWLAGIDAPSEDELVQAYSKTVKGAVVTVLIKDIKSRPVYFIGGFGRAGVLPLTRDYNVVQAVGVMGGVSPGGDA